MLSAITNSSKDLLNSFVYLFLLILFSINRFMLAEAEREARAMRWELKRRETEHHRFILMELMNYTKASQTGSQSY